MPKAIIADDEPLMRELLKEKLGVLWPELEILGEATDGVSALRLLDERRPDVAFLDIRMPGLSGIEVARAVTHKPKIVFVTAYDSYAVQAFEADAVDYIVKPIAMERLAKVVAKLKQGTAPRPIESEVLAKVLSHFQSDPKFDGKQELSNDSSPLRWLQVDVGAGKLVLVNVDDVHWLTSDTKYTRVVGDECDGLITTPLKDIFSRLDPLVFLQVHRSSIVNRRFIKAVHRIDGHMEIELRGHTTKIKISDSYRSQFKAM